MVAILFANPLLVPAAADHGNKIRWVTDDPAPRTGDPDAGPELVITGTLERGAATMRATVDGGPGPSRIGVPAPGCWLFDLQWSSFQKHMAIPYAAG